MLQLVWTIKDVGKMTVDGYISILYFSFILLEMFIAVFHSEKKKTFETMKTLIK